MGGEGLGTSGAEHGRAEWAVLTGVCGTKEGVRNGRDWGLCVHGEGARGGDS